MSATHPAIVERAQDCTVLAADVVVRLEARVHDLVRHFALARDVPMREIHVQSAAARPGERIVWRHEGKEWSMLGAVNLVKTSQGTVIASYLWQGEAWVPWAPKWVQS